MATLLKPRQEKPAILRFSCRQSLAARLKKLENAAEQQGVEIDLDAALATALERLVARAERECLPPAPASVQQRVVEPSADVAAQPSAVRTSDGCARAAVRGGNGSSQVRKTKPNAKPASVKLAA